MQSPGVTRCFPPTAVFNATRTTPQTKLILYPCMAVVVSLLLQNYPERKTKTHTHTKIDTRPFRMNTHHPIMELETDDHDSLNTPYMEVESQYLGSSSQKFFYTAMYRANQGLPVVPCYRFMILVICSCDIW